MNTHATEIYPCPNGTIIMLSQYGHEYSLCTGDGSKWALCARPLRGGVYCTMDPGHRGRCSSITFQCDGCGKRRRGQPWRTGPDGEYETGMGFCFMCSAEQVNNPAGLSYNEWI